MSSKQAHRRMSMSLIVATLGLTGSQAALAQRTRQNPIPAETVVHLKMDTALSSRNARVGDRFAAVLAGSDRSGFPEGTRFQGVVRQVQQHTKTRPGMLDITIQQAYFPGGDKIGLSGHLASLGSDDVRRMENGRLEALPRSGGKMDWKWAGYGAGAGAVLTTVMGGKLLNGVLLGGLGGAAYSYLTRNKGGKDRYRDVDLARGADFGMRLDRETPFNNRSNYRYATFTDPGDSQFSSDRQADDRRAEDRRAEDRRLADQRTADQRAEDRRNDDRRIDDRRNDDRRNDNRQTGERYDLRYRDATVQLNGRPITLTTPPMNVNGILYVPLAPIAAAANFGLNHRADQGAFALTTGSGRVRASAGDTRVTRANQETFTLSEEPISINGTLYVSADYLNRAANLSSRWDAANQRLDLRTQR